MDDEQGFLRRWSRRKHEAARATEPPVESLTIDSDFTPFLSAEVEETVKRAALRKLFSDPRFNVMDGLDVYIDDYSQADPIPEGLLDKLADVYKTLEEKAAEAAPSDVTAVDAEAPPPPAEPAQQTGDDADEREGPSIDRIG
jgi:hypothetical protein